MFKLFAADLKMLVRNRQLIFWSFAFPLIFTFIFGFFNSGHGVSIGAVLYVDKAHSSISRVLRDVLAKESVITLKDDSSQDDALSQIRSGKAVGAVVVPAGFTVSQAQPSAQITVLYDPGSVEGRAAIDGIVGGFLTQLNFRVEHVQPAFSMNEVPAGGTGPAHSYFDYLLIGLLGMALMNSAIQGLAISMSRYRENQILKRLAITPLSLWKFMLAEVCARLVINMAQVLTILAVGIYGFHAAVSLSAIGPLLALAIVCAMLFQLIGFSIAALTKTSDAAQGMAQSITIPMMFLSGIFFSTDGLPAWLRSIVQFLPLAPILHMMRAVSLDNRSILEPRSNIYIVVGWIVGLLFFVRHRFRLTEES